MRKIASLLTVTSAALLGACSTMSPGMDGATAATGETVSAPIIGTNGQQMGTVQLTQTSTGVRVQAQASGVPQGEHGFHFHETGRCDPAQGFTTAGGHFNPMGKEHGMLVPGGPHVGDMTNQSADASGAMTTDLVNNRISLERNAPGSIWDADGTALVIHAKPDDYKSQPSGAAGDRIGCAVIAAPM